MVQKITSIMVGKAWGLKWAGQLVVAEAYSSDFWVGRDLKWIWVIIYLKVIIYVHSCQIPKATHIANLPKQCHELGTKCLNMCSYAGQFTFKP